MLKIKIKIGARKLKIFTQEWSEARIWISRYWKITQTWRSIYFHIWNISISRKVKKGLLNVKCTCWPTKVLKDKTGVKWSFDHIPLIKYENQTSPFSFSMGKKTEKKRRKKGSHKSFLPSFLFPLFIRQITKFFKDFSNPKVISCSKLDFDVIF